MSALSHHLVRRGVESVTHPIKTGSAGDSENDILHQMSTRAVVLLVITTVLGVVALFYIQYIYGMVVATLTVVEDPQPKVYIPINLNNDDSDDGDDVNKISREPDADVLVAGPKPITSKLRTTILHLRDRAGRWSRFRGLGLFLIWWFCHGILVRILSFGAPALGIVYAIAQISSELILSTLELAWVHIVISEPSTKPLRKRIPGPSSWMKIAPAVALKATASQLCFLPPAYLGIVLHVFRPVKNSDILLPSEDVFLPPEDQSLPALFLALFAILILSVALTVLIEVPATVIMIRVAASMLPDDDKPIVPFDRTFGGKVTPTADGGSGKIGLLDAWKTFTWPSCVRLMKVLGKVFGMTTAVAMLCGFIFGSELAVIVGK